MMYECQRQGVATDDEIGHTDSYVSLLLTLILQSLYIDGASATHFVFDHHLYSLLCVHAYMCVGACVS